MKGINFEEYLFLCYEEVCELSLLRIIKKISQSQLPLGSAEYLLPTCDKTA